jgi:hypothetical protein
MKFEWDSDKDRRNIRKHCLSFADAAEMFDGILLIKPDASEDYGEERWIGIRTTRGRVAFVVFTEDRAGTIRIISLRKANHEERKEFEKTIKDGLEAH